MQVVMKFTLLLCVHAFINYPVFCFGRDHHIIYGKNDDSSDKMIAFEAPDEEWPMLNARKKRDFFAIRDENNSISVKMHYLKDPRRQIVLHYPGRGSNVIICLIRNVPSIDPIQQPRISTVLISYDHGDTFNNKTDLFKLDNSSYATVEEIYYHTNYNTHIVFTDTRNKYIFTTMDYGKTINKVALNFTPDKVQFGKKDSNLMFVLDKTDSDKALWYSLDFGITFKIFEHHLKSFDFTDNYLILENISASNSSTISYTRNLFLKTEHPQIFVQDVVDKFIIGDYTFYVKESQLGDYDLFVSYNFETPRLCIFDTDLEKKSYQVVDVTINKIIVSISHSEVMSHLYISDYFNMDEHSQPNVTFILSLENIMAYFPNISWLNARYKSMKPFTDIYKVEGMIGIYIATQMVPASTGQFYLSSRYLKTKITFDHGSTWRLLKISLFKYRGRIRNCRLTSGCSLHLAQEFTQLLFNSNLQTPGILGSRSAPGLLIANGVAGQNLNGKFGVYISLDAGLTWTFTLEEEHFYGMGNYGGLLIAVKIRYFAKTFLYSTNMGRTWKRHQFNEEGIRIYSIMTETDGNATMFTVFGSERPKHEWVIVNINLMNAFKYNCSEYDYNMWLSNVDGQMLIYCPLGKQQGYKRRNPNAECYNGQHFEVAILKKPCACTVTDYECDIGFKRNISNGLCVLNKNFKFDPHSVPQICQPGQNYNRTKGYRKISGNVCIEQLYNFYTPELIPCPIIEVPMFLLMARRNQIIRFDLISHQQEYLPLSGYENISTFDFDVINDCLFWFDSNRKSIERQCFDGNSSSEIIVQYDLASVNGITYDWVSRNLYFLDRKNARIELIKVDSSQPGLYRKAILTSPELREPNGIIVHPIEELLFWTDCSSVPTISKSFLDGTNITQLFKSPTIRQPNSITVDHRAETLYWVDIELHYIGCSDFNGNKFSKITLESGFVTYPYSLAIFGSTMYWYDRKEHVIFNTKSDHRTNVNVIINDIYNLTEIKLYSRELQNHTNPCIGSTCQFICVVVEHKAVCLCPNSYDMKNGRCVCPGGVEPYSNMTCSACDSNYFTCGDGQCIPMNLRCDRKVNCGNGEDEINCESTICDPNDFVCGNGLCLSPLYKCDFKKDCSDGSDELNCPMQNCTQHQFKCKNGKCISNRWRCDNVNDCLDNSDEQNCHQILPKTCEKYEFKCSTGLVYCIPSLWRCDGKNDCVDISDEKNCDNVTCSAYEFKCVGSNRCVYKSWICDGSQDCPDGSDEQNCSEGVTSPLPFVSNQHCHEWMFKCANNQCIPSWWRCDVHKDCFDGSDEINCSSKTTITSSYNVSDGMYDCGSTESEQSCTSQISTSASLGRFSCDTNISYPMVYYCDNVTHCTDGFDENNCTNIEHYYQVLTMNVVERTKTNSSIMLYWWIPTPKDENLQFLPSICRSGSTLWYNKTWTDFSSYTFIDLEPYTNYKMTVYVRIGSTQKVYPPAKFYLSMTTEGVPSIPLNISARQMNSSHILISWDKPTYSNGVIAGYKVGFYPPSPPTQIRLGPNLTSHLLTSDFKSETTYSFYVIAYNGKQASGVSEVISMQFDKNVEVESVKSLRAVNRTDSSITLSWLYEKSYDEFLIDVLIRPPYPKTATRRTMTTNIVIRNLAPGLLYEFKVVPRRKNLKGPASIISVATNGTELPEISIAQIKIIKDQGTSVAISWNKSKDTRQIKWQYGVYYGLTIYEVLEKSRFNTSSLMAIVNNLEACKTYFFAVGLIGPLGAGPLQATFLTIKTLFSVKAPPTDLIVMQGHKGFNTMMVKWSVPCPYVNQTVGYIITVTEMLHNQMSMFNLKSIIDKEVSHNFVVNFGGIYKVVVSTDVENTRPTKPVIYKAPPVPPVFNVRAEIEKNGSCRIYWEEYSTLPLVIANVTFYYEVQISEGNEINENNVQNFTIKTASFMYNNITKEMYSIAVFVKTEQGYKSVLSNVVQFKLSQSSKYIKNTNNGSVGIISIIIYSVLVVIGATLVYLHTRYKRFRNRNIQSANSEEDFRLFGAVFDEVQESLENESESEL